MRRSLLIFLAFLPAIAAYFLFRSFDQEEPPPAIERIDSADGGPKRNINEALTGFSGKGTFYSRLAPIILEGQELSFPSTYYLLDNWRREGEDKFIIDGLLVLRNERPVTLAELNSKLLKISNDGSSADRRAELEAARKSYDSLKAGRGRAVGGRTVAESDEFHLDQGVEARVPARDSETGELRIVSEQAHFRLAKGRLDVLNLPEAFNADHPNYFLSGVGLEAKEESSDVIISSTPRIEARGLKDGAKRIIRAAGSLVWRPDARKDGKNPDILDRVHFDFGTIDIKNEVVFEIDDMVLKGDFANLRLGNKDGSMSGKLTSFVMKGAVSMVSPRGHVKGDQARGTILENGAISVVVEGKRSEVSWAAREDQDATAAGGMVASCSGPMQLQVPALERRETENLTLVFKSEVIFDLRGQSEPVHLEGENLQVELGRVPLNRADLEADDAAPKFAWRFKSAVLAGRASGQAREYRFAAPRLAVKRVHDARGLHLEDLLSMDGRVEIEKTGGLGRSDPELRSFITASRKLDLRIPASPFADGLATAQGSVEIREKRGRIVERQLDCEFIEILSGPESSSLGEERRVLKSLVARDSVVAVDEKGSTLRGDLVTWTRVSRDGHVEGRPAVATFLDAKGKEQVLRAQVLDFNSVSGLISGHGEVAAELYFPALNFADSAPPPTDDERVMEKPSVLWNLSCNEFRARFTGTMPLGDVAATEEKVKAELAEFDLIGSARVENADQRILADQLHYDLLRKAGSAEGKPVKLRMNRLVETGEKLEEWLEAKRLIIEPEWTLMSGGSRALLHVAKNNNDPAKPKIYEPLRIDSQEDVLLKDTELVFTGRTHLVRGLPAEKGLDVEADQVTAVFAPDPSGKKSRGELQLVIGSGDVNLAWDELTGRGEVLTVDYVEKKVTLEAKPDESCFMTQGRGYTARSASVIYDMVTKKITQHKLRVERRSDQEKKP